MPTFERFSNGYYHSSCRIAKNHGDVAALNRVEYLEVCNEYYNGVGPLVMKLDGVHFPVYGEDAVPDGTLILPEDILSKTDANPPERRSVLLTKASALQTVTTAHL